jgi:heme-degrading monooxygenase HmoA
MVRMIVEVRTYRIKAGQREKFISFFENRAIPAQRSKGMRIVGPLLDLENPDVFIWLRAFPSLEDRERMKSALYDGEEWTTELEAIAMPMLEDYRVALTSMSAGFVDDLHATPGASSTQDA